MDNSALSKMQLHYWEAKQTFLKKVKRKEDDCVVASDAELDAKLELLRSIDETNQNLLNLLDLYQDRVCAVAQEECIIGRFMRECGKLDSSKAGKLMIGSGKTLLFASHQFIQLRSILVRVYRDVQTFQYRAVTDTFDTIDRMEKARTAYRAALLWMKDISKQLDPDAYGQMDKFKKVQNHVRKTKKTFEKLKMDSVQKIDLLSASRCNLFSNVLASYQNNLQNIWDKCSKVMNIFVETFQHSSPTYEFTMLRELNDASSEDIFESFETRLREILAQNNLNEKDMLVFFEADYSDDRDGRPVDGATATRKSPGVTSAKDDRKLKAIGSAKQSNKKEKEREKERNDATNKRVTDTPISSLLDFNFEIDEPSKSATTNEDILTSGSSNQSNNFMPSSLIDLGQMHQMNSAQLIKANFEIIQQPDQQEKKNAGSDSTTKNKENNLQSWLNLFSDIDPLSNPAEFEKFSSDKNHFDRNC